MSYVIPQEEKNEINIQSIPLVYICNVVVRICTFWNKVLQKEVIGPSIWLLLIYRKRLQGTILNFCVCIHRIKWKHGDIYVSLHWMLWNICNTFRTRNLVLFQKKIQKRAFCFWNLVSFLIFYINYQYAITADNLHWKDCLNFI